MMKDNLAQILQASGSTVITRFSKPTKWDTFPFGTIAEVFSHDPLDDNICYIQRSKDAENPSWEKI